jgi:hypothetical protein
VLRRRHGRHFLGPLLRLAYSSARGWSPGPKSRGGGDGPVAAALETAGQRVGGVLLASLQYKRKPAKAQPAKVATGFEPGRALNVTLRVQYRSRVYPRSAIIYCPSPLKPTWVRPTGPHPAWWRACTCEDWPHKSFV